MPDDAIIHIYLLRNTLLKIKRILVIEISLISITIITMTESSKYLYENLNTFGEQFE